MRISFLIFTIIAFFMAIKTKAEDNPLAVKPVTDKEPSKSFPKLEPYAFTAFNRSMAPSLDGPRVGAGTGTAGAFGLDEEDNMFFCSVITQNIRCIRADGRVVTITGEDHGNGSGANANPPSGPASRLRLWTPDEGGYQAGVGVGVRGLPLAGKGEIYVWVKLHGTSYRVWKNPDKGGRWWYKTVEAKSLPQRTGESVPAGDIAGMGGVVLKDGSEIFCKGARAYRLAGGKITCVLSPPDYEQTLVVKNVKTEVKVWGGFGGLTYDEKGDSYIITGYGMAWRYWPATKKIEHLAGTGGNEGGGPGLDGKIYVRDGPTWGARFWCGPRGIRPHPTIPDLFVPSSADEFTLKRIWKGRISSLCWDGEWREHDESQESKKRVREGLKHNLFSRKDPTVLYVVGQDHALQHFQRLSGIDWTKDTVGPLQEGK